MHRVVNRVTFLWFAVHISLATIWVIVFYLQHQQNSFFMGGGEAFRYQIQFFTLFSVLAYADVWGLGRQMIIIIRFE